VWERHKGSYFLPTRRKNLKGGGSGVRRHEEMWELNWVTPGGFSGKESLKKGVSENKRVEKRHQRRCEDGSAADGKMYCKSPKIY